MDIGTFFHQHTDLLEVTGALLLPIVSYIVKLFWKPSEKEARLIAKVLTFVIVISIKLIRTWYEKHNHSIKEHLDTMRAMAFDLKGKLKSDRIGEVVLG